MMRAPTLIAMTVLLAFTGISFAGGGRAAFRGEGGGGFVRIRQILAGLDLSTDQKTQTDSILDSAAEQVRSLHSQIKNGGDQSATREQMRSLRQQTIQKIKQVLNTEQKTKFEAQLKQLRESVKSRHQSPTTQPQN